MFSPQIDISFTSKFLKGGDFMERRSEISGLEEQYDPAEAAINEQQGPVDLTFIDTIRARSRAVIENGSQPTTHPLVGNHRASGEFIFRVDPASGTALLANASEKPSLDQVDLKSLTAMNGGE